MDRWNLISNTNTSNIEVEIMMSRIAILGAGESGTGAALLAKVKGFEVFVSDQGIIKDKYRDDLVRNKIEFEEGTHTELLYKNDSAYATLWKLQMPQLIVKN